MVLALYLSFQLWNTKGVHYKINLFHVNENVVLKEVRDIKHDLSSDFDLTIFK